MIRHYATLTGPEGPWQIHYREAGAGLPCVLLHPSPLSSAALVPTIDLLAPIVRCLALDTPGYGYSDPLPKSCDTSDLGPYVSAVADFVSTLGLERPILYGSATGAQIAIEFAKTHAELCGGLLLENVALFSEEERANIIDGYFPDISPKDDGLLGDYGERLTTAQLPAAIEVRRAASGMPAWLQGVRDAAAELIELCHLPTRTTH
ncbi:MAG: alpha/beta fold hydrolase [Congregibacter sp.]